MSATPTPTPTPLPTSNTPPIGKILVGGAVALATVSAIVAQMDPTVAFYLMAGSSGLNAFAAYLGWSA